MEQALLTTSFEIPAVFACRLAGKKCGNFKKVDDKAGSILYTKNKISLTGALIMVGMFINFCQFLVLRLFGRVHSFGRLEKLWANHALFLLRNCLLIFKCVHFFPLHPIV